MKYPIATKSAVGRSKPLTAELLVNMYAEQAPDGARNQVAAIGCPGLSVFSDISSDYIRGVHWSASDSTLWVVAGLTLYKVASAGVATSIGTVGGYGRVGMADNGIEIVITSSAIAYTVTLATNTLAPITDNDYPNSYTVAFLDGYFLFANNQTGSRGQFFISGLYDGDAYDALDFATAENAADNLVRVWRDHDRVLLFGDDTTETWFNSGDADFPFAPYKGSTLNRGLGARWSVANVDNRVIFLDDNGIVRVADEAGTRISTHAIEYQISQGSWRHDDSASYDGAFASTYVEEGHEFYCLTVPNTGTFVFDAATGLWHTRKSRGLETSRTSFHVKAFNKIICGDIETGKLYEQSLSYYDEAGEYLIAEIQFPQIVNDNRRFTVNALQLNMEVGVGLSDEEINAAYGDVLGACNIEGAWITQTSAADNSWQGIVYGDEFVTVSSDGTSNVAISSDGEDWTLAVAGDPSTTFTYGGDNVDLSAPLNFIYSTYFKADGTKFYAYSNGHTITEFSTASAFVLTGATATGVSKSLTSHYDAGGNGRGLWFAPDGAKFFATGDGKPSAEVTRWNMSESWDLSTATLSQSLDLPPSTTQSAGGLCLSNDGLHLYVHDEVNAVIRWYEMSSAFDLTTATQSGTMGHLGAGAYYNHPSIYSNGTVFLIGYDDFIAFYTLSTPYDITTASLQSTINIRTLIGYNDLTIDGATLSNDGSFLLVTAGTGSTDGSSNPASDVLFKIIIIDPAALYGVGFDGTSTYVAVGDEGAFYSTNGGISWAASGLKDAGWKDVCWFSGISKFMTVAATGTGNLVATSSDGETWTEQTQTTGMNAVDASATSCVMVGGSGIKRTTNGTSFTTITEPADQNWTGICYSSLRARWVIVSNDGTGTRAAYSDDDGVTWKLTTTPADYNWNSVAFGAGYFVAVADTGTGQRIMRSRFGDEWELVDSPADNGWNDLAWSESLCLFAAVSDSGTGNRVMTSAKSTAATDTEEGSVYATAAREPYITLDVSSDTRTFDITQPWRSFGKQGEYQKRIIWRRLGQHRSFTPRFTISAPVKRIVFDATIELTPNG